jgi:peroxiredoxin 2/4
MIVGTTAPGFTTNALINGQDKNISLQDYRGKWVLLFFYSADFTYV